MIDVPIPAGWTVRRFDKLLASLHTAMPEAAWANVVHQLLDGYGWVRLHIPPVKVGRTWVTPGRKGFPDVLAIHPEGVGIVLELKTDAAKFDKPDQRMWMGLWQRLARRCPDVITAAVVRPCDVETLLPYLVPPSRRGAERAEPQLPLDSGR